MKRIIFALCLTASAQLIGADFHWDGGNLQFDFTSTPYQQREPKITQEEFQVLNKVVDLVKQQREADGIVELELQLARRPSAALWFSLAHLQQQQQQDKAAINSLRKAIELLPHFTRAHEALGMLFSQQGDFTDARPHLRQAASQGPRAEVYAMLGYGYLQTKQPQAARAAYSHALMLAGDNPQWQRGLMYAALAAGDDQLARSLTDQLLASAPEDAQLYQLRASLAQRQQHWPEVIASLEIARQLAPKDEIRWQLAQIYLEQGYYSLAQPHIRHLLNNGIRGRQQRLLEMADYLIAQQQTGKASEILNKLLGSNLLSDHERSHGLTSQAKLLSKNNAKTTISQQTDLLDKALALNSLNGRALLDLAGLYQNSRPEHAEMLYQRAAVLPSVKLEALQRHAQLLLVREAYQRAESLMQQAVKHAPNNQQLRDNLAVVTRMVQSQG